MNKPGILCQGTLDAGHPEPGPDWSAGCGPRQSLRTSPGAELGLRGPAGFLAVCGRGCSPMRFMASPAAPHRL